MNDQQLFALIIAGPFFILAVAFMAHAVAGIIREERQRIAAERSAR